MGRVISRLEDKGLTILAMKMLRVTPDLARQHYAEHVHKPFYPGLEAFITGGPVVAMVIEGTEVIRVLREMLGATNGRNAAAGTIRGDFGCSRQMNLVHGSDSPEAARREIELYFRPEEIGEGAGFLAPWLRAADE
jgi:nucleoside-diphosphate kinase